MIVFKREDDSLIMTSRRTRHNVLNGQEHKRPCPCELAVNNADLREATGQALAKWFVRGDALEDD